MGIDLRDDLTEEQEQERQDNRLEDEASGWCRREVEDLRKGVARQDDDGHIHQIVTDEDSRQEALRVLEQLDQPPISRLLLLLNQINVGGREREEGYFGGGHKARDDEEYARDREGNPRRERDGCVDDLTE